MVDVQQKPGSLDSDFSCAGWSTEDEKGGTTAVSHRNSVHLCHGRTTLLPRVRKGGLQPPFVLQAPSKHLDPQTAHKRGFNPLFLLEKTMFSMSYLNSRKHRLGPSRPRASESLAASAQIGSRMRCGAIAVRRTSSREGMGSVRVQLKLQGNFAW